MHPIANWNEDDRSEFIDKSEKLDLPIRVGDWVCVYKRIELVIEIHTHPHRRGLRTEHMDEVAIMNCVRLALEGDLMDLPEWEYDWRLGKTDDGEWDIYTDGHSFISEHKHRLMTMIRAVTE